MTEYRGRKVVVVTGATSGIGLATVRELARLGHRPIMVGKHREDVARALDELAADLGAGAAGAIEVEVADLSRPHAVDELAVALRRRRARIDALINNAGVLSEELVRTPEGHEVTWAVNVLAPFRLTARLLPHLVRSGPARVINVSSTAHRNADGKFDASTIEVSDSEAFDGFLSYARTKLALIAFTRRLATRLPAHRCVVHSLHPGIVNTSLPTGPGRVSDWMRFGAPVLLPPRRGALTPVFLATSELPQVVRWTGLHWWGRRVVRPSAMARDEQVTDAIWRLAAGHNGGLEPRWIDGPS